jgi:Cys-rich repeat protein
MRRWIFVACAVLTITGCTDQSELQQGTERGACYPNNSCNAGLTCLSHFCVRVPDAGSDMAAGSDSRRDLNRADTLPPPPPCTTPADCPPGTICNKGTCIPGKPCTTDKDCQSGQTCIKNQCMPAKPCKSDKDCPPGRVCKNGSCVLDKPKPDVGAPDLMSKDQSVPDQSVPDQSVPDQSVGDQ